MMSITNNEENMTEKTDKTLFQQLREIDVSEQVEKKNGFNYLSWAWALDKMYQFDDAASFEFPEREVFNDGTVMIYCEVTIKGAKKRGFLPVMDYKNTAIKNPDARKMSDSMMRCLVKTIGLHGLGLSLYAGEDLPDSSKDETQTKAGNKAPPKDAKPEDPKRAVYAKMKEQIEKSPDLETLNYVWTAFKKDQPVNGVKFSDLPDVGQKSLTELYTKRLTELSQAPIAEDNIPY